jgi:hypothetical protein
MREARPNIHRFCKIVERVALTRRRFFRLRPIGLALTRRHPLPRERDPQCDIAQTT